MPRKRVQLQRSCLPLELCVVILQFTQATTDRFRLACVNRNFSDAARLTASWTDLQVRCVGVKISRSGRKIIPSEEAFLEELSLFVRQRRFRAVKTLDATYCHLGEPRSFFSLMTAFLPALETIQLTGCMPDFHWAFLRWERVPPATNATLVTHPALRALVYGEQTWSRVDTRFVKTP